MDAGTASCLLLLLALARAIQVNTKYVIKSTESCPDVGYYFKREPAVNAVSPGPCFLCFCQENNTALCWERDSRRCDVERYHHHRVGRQSRYRRSPVGLGDIFFRDASRDFFNRRLPEQCKPFESSFSDGCPPADWCLGCTVCDCDANGRWDCHILSFCEGKEKKKKVKPRRRIMPNKRSPVKGPQTKTTNSPNKQPKIVNKSSQDIKRNINKKQFKPKSKLQTTTKPKPNRKPVTKEPKKFLRRSPTKKPPQKNQVKKSNNGTRVKVIKKYIGTRKPVNAQGANMKKMINQNNDTLKLGQMIVKQVMTTVQKVLMREMQKINATRVQRSASILADGKDCGEVKKMDKKTYNVKSKTAARNKNKYSRKKAKRDDFSYGRYKRQILDENQAEADNITVLSLLRENKGVIPLTVKTNVHSSTGYNESTTLHPKTILEQDNYYKYSLTKSINYSTVTESTQNQTTVTISNTNDNYSTKADIVSNFTEAEIKFNVNTDAVDKNSRVNTVYKNKSTNVYNPEFNDLKFNKWYVIKIKNEADKKVVNRIVLPKIKVNEVTNAITTQIISIQSTTEKNDGKIKDAKNFFVQKQSTNANNLKKYMSRDYHFVPNYSKASYDNNRTDITGLQSILQNLFTELNKNNTKAKLKPKIGIIKYLPKFFNNLFSKKQTRVLKKYGMGCKEDRTLQILCENFGPCRIKKRNKFILKYKLKQINNETKNILRSIKTIKGLLHLLDLPTNTNTSSNSLKNDALKLKSVLKGTYVDEGNTALTDTQITQINYIKSNTQTFIESVKKFADVLNETIHLIKSNENTKSQTKNNTATYERIKKMLVKYNIIQNTFIKKIYELINGIENTTTEKSLEQVRTRDLSDDETVRNFSRNIIQNLRRLKSVATALEPTRRKRHMGMRDDALEYLLTLMEHLLHRHSYPTNAEPANDGIDFLLDAIKSAPAIKPVQKKVLEYISKKEDNIKYMATTESLSSMDMEVNDTEERTDSKRISKEESNTINDDNIDDNSWPVDAATEAQDVPQKELNTKPNIGKTTENNITHDVTTEYRIKNDEEDITPKFDKYNNGAEDMKKDESFSGDIEEDTTQYPVNNVLPLIVNTTEDNTQLNAVETAHKRKEVNSESEDSSDRKSKMDWIEESFDKESKEYGIANVSAPTPTPLLPTLTPAVEVKRVENIESYTLDADKKHSSESKADRVMHRKQIELLHSLDYGTEKADLENEDSKEDNRSDDWFPNYFG